MSKESFDLYSDVVIGRGADDLARLAGLPWDVAKVDAAVVASTEQAMLRQRDDTRKHADFYKSWHLPAGSFALRRISSMGRPIAGLWLQNF